MSQETTQTPVQSYADRSRQAREDRMFRFGAGEYIGRFKDWKFKKSKKNNDMFELEFKVIQAPTPEILEKARLKDRKIIARFTMSVDFQFDNFLNFLEDLGADLSQCRPQAQDPQFMDFRAILDELERLSPDLKMELKPQQDDPRYYDVYFRDVQEILRGAPAGAQTPAEPNAAPAAPAAAPFAFYMDGANVAKVYSQDELQTLIDGGYTGQVNIGNVWKTAQEHGFAPAPVAAPVEEPAPAPANEPAPAPVDPEPVAAPTEPAPANEPAAAPQNTSARPY